MVRPALSVETADRRFLRLIGCFSRGIRSGFRVRALGVAAFSGSAGKNRKPPSTTRFLATKPQVVEVLNKGLVSRSRIFTALPESLHGSMPQIPNQRAYRPFRAKKPQVEAMLHAGVLGKF